MSKTEVKIRKLTRAEEEVMQIMWDLENGIIKDIIERFDEPKPAYTTVATVLKVLERKKFVDYKRVGNTYLYSPVISKTEYTKFQLSSLLKNYFNGSFPKMATFFARENDLSLIELEEMLKEALDDIDNNKTTDNE